MPIEGMIDRDTFRDALALWPSGVAVVACRTDERVVATTVSAFLSLSLDPPRILVAIGPNATVRPFLEVDAVFAINILSAGQRRLAMVFADAFPVGPDPFPPAGVPLIDGSLIALTCIVERIDEGSDHAIVIAAVTGLTRGEGPALVRYDRSYHELDV